MPHSIASPSVLDREFIALRAKLIELAAGLDRLDRAREPIADDLRYQKLLKAIRLLQENAPDRAEKIQMLFSLPYDEQWRAS